MKIFKSFFHLFRKKQKTVSCKRPILLSINNVTDDTKKAVLFGSYKFYNKPNYGSDEGILITSPDLHYEYCEIFQRCAHEPFFTSKIRFHVVNSKYDIDQFKKDVTYIMKDNSVYMDSIRLNKNYDEAMQKGQFQKTRLDVTYHADISGKSYFELDILPHTDLWITFFPEDYENFINQKR